MGSFLVHMHHGRNDRFRCLMLFDKFQPFIKELFYLSSFLSLEELRRSCDQSFHHTHTVRTCAASSFSNLFFRFCPIFSLWCDQMKIQMATTGINIRITVIFFFGSFIMSFNLADFRSFIFGKSKDCILWCISHYLSLRFCHTIS